jgi:hypothetical protein
MRCGAEHLRVELAETVGALTPVDRGAVGLALEGAAAGREGAIEDLADVGVHSQPITFGHLLVSAFAPCFLDHHKFVYAQGGLFLDRLGQVFLGFAYTKL